MSNKLFLTDVSAAETDDTCGMRYWLRYLEGGGGIINREHIVPNLIDEAVHDDFRAIASMPDISAEAVQASIDETLAGLSEEEKKDQKKMELLYRRLGWAAAWAIFMEPDIRDGFDAVPIDNELVFDADPLFVMAYPDRIIRSKLNGDVIYREIDTNDVPFPADRWAQSWVYRVRLHVGMAAAQQTLDTRAAGTFGAKGIKITFGQMMGLQGGFYSNVNGRLVHPYVWGKRNILTGAWAAGGFDMDGQGWMHAPVWEFEGGIVEWVKMAGKKIAAQQFPLSPFVRMNPMHLSAWVARRLHRERAVYTVKDISLTNLDIRNIHFERKTANCRPQDGQPCPYLAKCWLPDVNKASMYVSVASANKTGE